MASSRDGLAIRVGEDRVANLRLQVHVGGKELAHELEAKGYGWLETGMAGAKA